MIARQHKDLNDKLLGGLIDNQDSGIELNRISHNLIQLVSGLNGDAHVLKYFGLPVPENVGPTTNDAARKPSSIVRRWAWMVPFVMMGLLAVFFMLPKDGSKATDLQENVSTNTAQDQTEAQSNKDKKRESLKPITHAKSDHSTASTGLMLHYNQPLTAKLLSKKDEHYYYFIFEEDLKNNVDIILANNTDTFQPTITIYDTSRKGEPRLFDESAREPGQDIRKEWTARKGHQYRIVIYGKQNDSYGDYQLMITETE